MIGLLLASGLAASSLQLDYTRQSLTSTVRHYKQTIDGRDVVGGERIEVTRNGATRVVYERLAERRDERDRARVASVCEECVYVNVAGEARLARREIVHPRPLEPHAIYTDAITGAVLRDDELFVSAKARVFDVNPVAKLNDPSLRDQNDAASAVPSSAYSTVDIVNLDPATPLSGPNARIVDTQAPFTAHADPSQSLEFDRSQPQFEEVNAYFHIDRSQRYLQSLGYTGARRLVDYAIPIDPHAANGTDNSFYLQQTPPGHGALFFGDGGTDDAEDSDIMQHEFFHAVQDWIAPGALAGAPSSEARAISEGSADYWSFSSNYAATAASGRDPYCIADWDARCGGDDPSQQCGYAEGTNCLRRVDSANTMTQYNRSSAPGTEYDNGAIWSSALRELFGTIGKPVTDTLVIESLFGIPPQPTFKVVAQKMIEADMALRFGAETSAICSVFTARGILAAGDCVTAPRGEWTYFTAPDTIAIPDAGAAIESSIVVNDTRTIDRVAVRVDIEHPVRGDLVITLVAPNGTEVRLKQSLDVDRTPGVHATFGIDAMPASSLDVLHGISAAGTWKLRVQDVFAPDTGKLEHWNLVIQFAGDAPLTTRPASTERLVIPVVSHITGAGGITWTSDVQFLGNGHDVTLVFTPSEHDGRTDFAALKFATNEGEVVTVTDVVAQMGMLGSGQLEIQGARAATARIHGGGWESMAAVAPFTGATSIRGIRNDATVRTNIGFAETSGFIAPVTLRIGSATYNVVVPPFSHVQFSVAESGDATFTVEGPARVLAYAAVIERQTNDVTFHPALVGGGFAPSINIGEWHNEPPAQPGYGIISEFSDAITRIVHDTPSGRYAEALTFESGGVGELLGVESSDRFRTNIALVNNANDPRTTTLRDFDADGHLLRTQTIGVGPRGIVLIPLQTPAARVSVEGNLLAWASVIENATGDPMLVPLQ